MSYNQGVEGLTGTAGRPATLLGRVKLLDLPLLVATLILTAFGIFAMYIAGDDGPTYAVNQALGAAGGLAVAGVVALTDYRLLHFYAKWVYGATLAGLATVLLFGSVAGGAQSWINLGPVQVQPSEFAKLFMIVVLAAYASSRNIGGTVNFSEALALLALPALLVFLQPDLGTALVFGAIFVMMSFVGGARLWQLAALLGAGAGLFALAVRLEIIQAYQLARLTAFVNPSGAPDVAYQVTMSKEAIGSGGFGGKGIEATTLGRLGFLPEDQTDFIFASLAEQLGFIGSGILLALFFVLIWRILHVATVSRDRFGVLLAVGIGTMFMFHVFVNVGMAMQIMPVTGIPLPFISYGRSSLIVGLISLGLLQSIVVRAKYERAKQSGS